MEILIGYALAGLVTLGGIAYWGAGKLARYQQRQLERILDRYTQRSSSSGLDIVRIGESTHIMRIASSRAYVVWKE